MEWGSYQELLSSMTLASFQHQPMKSFSTWAKRRGAEGDVPKVQPFISGNGRTSLHPPLHNTHMHTHCHSHTAQLFTSGKGIWYLQ